MTDIAAAEFLTAFQSRRAVGRALLELSRRQAALIACDDYSELIEVLKSKQALLEHLGQLAREQSPLRTAWPVRRDFLPSADRARCEAVLSETESLLAELLAEEQSSSSLLSSRRDATGRELQSLTVGVHAQQAYQSRPQPVLSRLDLNT